MRLLISDVDDTLVDCLDAHLRAYHLTLHEVYGVHDGLCIGAGMTIHQIFMKTLLGKGFSEEDVKKKLPDVDSTIGRALSEELKKEGSLYVFPGAEELLQEAQSRDYILAVGTGNSRSQGEAILYSADLMQYFHTGAYGDDAMDREGVFRKAIERAKRIASIDDVIVLGDSPSDVVAGNAVGARVVNVLTGPYKDDTSQDDAFLVVEDLSDYQGIMDALEK